MVDKNAKAAADRFIKKLSEKGFVMSRSRNTSEDYDKAKQYRDSKAVEEFTQTNIFQDIMKLR